MRIQILQLPTQTVGEYSSPRFALVVDEFAVGSSDSSDEVAEGAPGNIQGFQDFAEQIGAAGVLVADRRIEVV